MELDETELTQWFNRLEHPKFLIKISDGYRCGLGFNRKIATGRVTGVDIEHEGNTKSEAIFRAKNEFEFLLGKIVE